MLTSTDVKFTFDSAHLRLLSSVNILQIADVALRVLFLLFLPYFQLLFRVVLTLKTSEMFSCFHVCFHYQNNYSGTPPYDHPVYMTTSLLRPYSFKPKVKKTLTHFIILKTPLMRPPRYYDQDFMAQRWSY